MRKIENKNCMICGCKVTSGYTTISPERYDGEWAVICEDCYKNLKYKANVNECLDKLNMTEDGWVFVSKRGIKYNLFEGLTIGGKTCCSSDMIFIVCASDVNCGDSMFVNFCAGSFMLNDPDNKDDIEEMEDNIRYYVEEYEEKNFDQYYKLGDIIMIENQHTLAVEVAYVTEVRNGKVVTAFDGVEGGCAYIFDYDGVSTNYNGKIIGKATYEEICKWFAEIRKENNWFTEEE